MDGAGPASGDACGDLLRRYRIAAGLTQDQLAERASMSVRGISDLERGERTHPQRETVRLLVAALGLADAERSALLAAVRSAPRLRLDHDFPGAAPRERPAFLPAPLTRLIGREQEIADVRAALQDGDVRLVTLTGPGGVGKTRIALQVAAEMREDFADGVWLVDLSLLDDAALVISAISTALGVRGETSELGDRLASVLSGQHGLLVLDSFERVIDAGHVISDLLAKAPGMKALAMSRTPLHAYGERAYPLAPLALPDATPPLQGEAIGQYAAVRLFVERAQAVEPAFVVTRANGPAVAEICHRLDGLPLAIELAAPFVKMLPPQALLKRLDKRLPLLAGGARSLPARQQTMRAAITWSHDLLTGDEQALFRELSVFAGGCTLEAVEAVVAPRGVLDVFGGMASLIDKSLLRREGGAEEESRFRMLETVREFGLECLDAAGDGDAVRQRHAVYFAALGRDGDAERELGLAVAATLDRFERDIDNLRAAMTWTEQAGDAETGLVVASTFASLVFHRVHLAEGRERLGRLLGLDGDVPHAVRARAVCMLGYCALFQGDIDAAEQAAREAIERAAAESPVLPSALNLLGCVFWDRGLLAEAQQAFEDGLATAHGHPNADDLTPWILNNVGILAQQQGQHRAAREAYEAALAALRSTGVSFGHALIAGNLAHLAWEEGDQWRSASLALEALELARTVRNAYVAACTLEVVVLHACAAGRAGTAARLLGAADMQRRRVGAPVDPQFVAARHALLAQVRELLGEAVMEREWSGGEALSLDQSISEGISVMAEVTHRLASAVAPPEEPQDGN